MLGNSGYKCKYRSTDADLQESIRRYCELYNRLIDFEQYYHTAWKEPLVAHGKCKCRLHDEVHGESFSYKKSAKFWSCWGTCKVNAGGIVEYHQIFLTKHPEHINGFGRSGSGSKSTRAVDGPVSIILALNNLQERFTYLPKFTRLQTKTREKESIAGLAELTKLANAANTKQPVDKVWIKEHVIEDPNISKYDKLDTFTLDMFKIFVGDTDKLDRALSEELNSIKI